MKFVPYFILVTVCVFSCKKQDYNAAPKEVSKSAIAKAKWTNEVIVTFDADDAAGKSGFAVKEKVHTAMEKHGAKPFYVLSVPDVPQAIEALKKNPHVESVSPNYIQSIPEGQEFYNQNQSNLKTKKLSQNQGYPPFDVPLLANGKIVNIPSIAPQFQFSKNGYASKIIARSITNIRNNKNSPSVNRSASTATYPNDSIYLLGQQWGLDNIGCPQVWPTNKGSQKIYVGNIDEGCYYAGDLCGQVDYHHSYDFFHGDNNVFDYADTHGTATAGEYGALTNNGFGLAGIMPNVTIIVGKFLEGSGSTQAAIQAIDYMTHLKVDSGFNIIATNNSWGYQGSAIPELRDAIRRAGAAGILFNAAAGNSGVNTDSDPFYPADFCDPRDTANYCDNVISCGALASNDQPASFSCFGVNTVDIFAPGVGIACLSYDNSGNQAYWFPSGTSMATPMVTGACIAYKSGHPNATYADIKAAILANGRSLAILSDKCRSSKTLDIRSFTQGSTDIPVNRTDCVLPVVDTTTPTPLTNARVIGVTDHTITIAWDSSQHAYFYGINIVRRGIPDVQISTFSTQLTLQPFPTGDSVYFQIWPISKINKYGQPSPQFLVETTGPHDFVAPQPVTNYHIYSQTTDNADSSFWTVTIAWTPSPESDIMGHYGDGTDLRPNGINHYTYAFYSWKNNAGVLVNALSIGGMPRQDTFDTRVQSIDSTGNRSGFIAMRFIVGTGSDTTPPPPPPPPALSVILTGSVTSLAHILQWTITGKPISEELDELVSGVWVSRATTGLSFTYSQKGKKPRTWRVLISDGVTTVSSNQITLR